MAGRFPTTGTLRKVCASMARLFCAFHMLIMRQTPIDAVPRQSLPRARRLQHCAIRLISSSCCIRRQFRNNRHARACANSKPAASRLSPRKR
jgi:hypothetical protein